MRNNVCDVTERSRITGDKIHYNHYDSHESIIDLDDIRQLKSQGTFQGVRIRAHATIDGTLWPSTLDSFDIEDTGVNIAVTDLNMDTTHQTGVDIELWYEHPHKNRAYEMREEIAAMYQSKIRKFKKSYDEETDRRDALARM